jgi:hypothetical protein
MNTIAEQIQIPQAQRLIAAAGAVAMTAGAGMVAYFDPGKAGFFPVCPLYTLTGIACPGCGLTRGFHALLHGDLLGALDYNALTPIFAVIFGYLFVSMVLVAYRGRGLNFSIIKPKYLWGFMCFALVFAVLRNLPVYPFSVLYP